MPPLGGINPPLQPQTGPLPACRRGWFCPGRGIPY